jgi:hypothetical protein
MVKNLAIAAAFLFAVTIANTEDGVKFGARYGYSLQMLGQGDFNEAPGMGMLGISGGFVVNIPAGPVVIAPEVAFIYRTVSNFDSDVDHFKSALREMAISVPVMVKFFPMEDFFLQSGVQFDIPFGAKSCEDFIGYSHNNNCYSLKGKQVIPIGRIYCENNRCYSLNSSEVDRASVDIGIPMGLGYMITPRFSFDLRYVLGLTQYATSSYEYGSLSTIGLGLNGFF